MTSDLGVFLLQGQGVGLFLVPWEGAVLAEGLSLFVILPATLSDISPREFVPCSEQIFQHGWLYRAIGSALASSLSGESANTLRTTNMDYQGSARHDNFCHIGYFCTVGHTWSATAFATYAQ